MWTFEPTNSTQAGIVKHISGIFRFEDAKTDVAISKTDVFRVGTAKTSVFSNSASPADSREDPIKKKAKKKKRRTKSNYKRKQTELKKEEDKKRDIKQIRWKEKAKKKKRRTKTDFDF